MQTILLVEDEAAIRRLVKDYLTRDGYNVLEASDGNSAISLFKDNQVDLIVLDLMIPHLNGFEVCRTIRTQSNVPIIILSALEADDDKLRTFDYGADEYVTKPFSPKVLVARVNALIRRSKGSVTTNSSLYNINGLSINLDSRKVTVDSELITLSPKEFELLEYLLKNKNIVLSRSTLLDNIWGYDYLGDLRTVDTHIRRLREKLGVKAELITTVRGKGYMFDTTIGDNFTNA